MLHPDHAGQGTMTRVARAAVTEGFAKHDWPHIDAACWHDNAASRRILTKLGFVHRHTAYARGAARGVDQTCRFRLTRARALSVAAQ